MGESEGMLETRNTQASKVKISDIFFIDTSTQPRPQPKKEKREKRESFDRDRNRNNTNPEEFAQKGTNIKLEERYDVHFTIGSGEFGNILSFMIDISYDMYIIFRNREAIFVAIDPSNTHAAVVKIEKTEFLDSIYETGLDNESEKIIFIDASVIVEELVINENYPIDFYVDTEDKHRFYVICNKGYVWKQTTFITEPITTKYKYFKDTLQQLISNQNYQRIIVNPYPLMNLFKSVSKKKKKDADVYIRLYLNKTKLKFVTEDENKGSCDVLTGEDVLVYPINDDESLLISEYFTKFGDLKLTNHTNLYIYGTNLPIIMESKLGGGRITVSYLIAPRVESDI